MELLILVPIIGLLALYIAYKEWLNIAYRQWQAEMDLFKRRLAAYDELKSAVGGASAGAAAVACRYRALRSGDVGHAISVRRRRGTICQRPL